MKLLGKLRYSPSLLETPLKGDGDRSDFKAGGFVRRMGLAVVVMAAVGCVGARNWNDCNETRACQALAAERTRLFDQAVAEARPHVTPPARLTRVASNALVDRNRGLVYVGTPTGLVAFDLLTGMRRGQRTDVRASALDVAGPRVIAAHIENAVPRAPATMSMLVWSATSDGPTAPACRLELPGVFGLDTSQVQAFEYDGHLHLLWQTGISSHGGTERANWAEERDAATHCGLLKVDPVTCSASPVAQQAFMWPLSSTMSLKPPALCRSSEYDMPVRFVAPMASDVADGPRTFVEKPKDPCVSANQLVVQRSGVELWRVEFDVPRSSLCVP